MTGTLAIGNISDDLKSTLRQFRFSKSQSTNAIILKIDREDRELKIDEKLEDCDIDEIRDELPPQQPRYVLVSYQLHHGDGRVSYPMCLIFYSPSGCSPELQMLYAGSRNNLAHECELTKNFEIRDLDELTKELLDEKLA